MKGSIKPDSRFKPHKWGSFRFIWIRLDVNESLCVPAFYWLKLLPHRTSLSGAGPSILLNSALGGAIGLKGFRVSVPHHRCWSTQAQSRPMTASLGAVLLPFALPSAQPSPSSPQKRIFQYLTSAPLPLARTSLLFFFNCWPSQSTPHALLSSSFCLSIAVTSLFIASHWLGSSRIYLTVFSSQTYGDKRRIPHAL